MVDEVELLIEDIAFGGKGVGRLEGKAVFLPFTIAGERIAARIVREKKSFAEAELIRIIEPSPHRIAARCPYFGCCGGCAYQQMHYAHQLEWKARQVEQALRRIGKFPDPPMRPIVPSPNEYEYRNRITVHVEDGVVGFFRYNQHRLIEVEQCPIARPEVNGALRKLRARRPHDGHYTLRADAEPRLFSQINDAVAAQLAETITHLVPTDCILVVDAYCGAGFFAKRVVAGGVDPSPNEISHPRESRGHRLRLQRVIGLDWDIHAISAARLNATGIETYVAGDVGTHLAVELAKADLRLTTVIADPPAVGLSAEVRAALRQHPVATLLYVSCNPPTLARDLADLGSAFRLESVTPFDMFPQTAEIEVLAHLTANCLRTTFEPE